MTSYDDFIGDATAMMYMNKYDFGAEKNGTKLAAFKLWNLNFKAAPKAGVSIAHNQTTQQTWNVKSDSYDQAEKTSTKFGLKHDDVKFDFAATNDKWSLKVSSPISKDEWKVDGSVNYEEKPLKSRKVTIDAGVESPDMSGVVAAIGVSVDQEWKNEKEWTKGDHNASFNAALTHGEQNVLLGFSVETDGKELSASEAMIMKKDGDNKFWLGYDHGYAFTQAGVLIDDKESKLTVAGEVRYHFDAKKAKQQQFGFMEQPLSFVLGCKHAFSEKTTMNCSAELKQRVHAQAKFTHKLDKNWTVAAHQSFNANSDKSKHPYQLGFDVNYTL